MAEHAYTIAARVLTLGDSSPKWIAGCIGDDSIAITADAAWKSLEGKLCLKSALAEQEIALEFSSDASAPTASVLASAIDPRIIAAPGDLKVWAYAEGEDTRIQTTILTEVIEGARAKEYTFEYPVTVQNIGTKEITANGTYDADDDGFDAYSSVTVNVEGGGATFGLMSGVSITDGSGVEIPYNTARISANNSVIAQIIYGGDFDISYGMSAQVAFGSDYSEATATCSKCIVSKATREPVGDPSTFTDFSFSEGTLFFTVPELTAPTSGNMWQFTFAIDGGGPK